MTETTKPASIGRVELNEDGSATLRLRNVRLSFPHLFTPREQKSDDGTATKKTYQASFLLPIEGDPNENLRNAKAAVMHCIKVGLKGKNPGSERVCLRSGASKGEQGLEGYDDTMFFLSASSKDKPVTVDRSKRNGEFVELKEEDGKLYGGCYVNATVRLWPQDNKFGKRVNAQLKAVQFYADGEPFGAPRVKAENEFGDVEEAPVDELG